jgi:hypothetical protein
MTWRERLRTSRIPLCQITSPFIEYKSGTPNSPHKNPVLLDSLHILLRLAEHILWSNRELLRLHNAWAAVCGPW